MSHLTREEGLHRLEGAEAAARRVLQTLEVHVARSGSGNDVLELLSAAEHEAELALADLRGTRLEATGRRFPLSELSRKEGLQRLGNAEAAARRALQTIERQAHLVRNGSDDDVLELLSTAEHEVDLVLAELRGSLLEVWDPVPLVSLYLSRAERSA